MNIDFPAHANPASVSGLICVIDFANYPFIRRFAGHLNRQRACAYLYNPNFQSPNQRQQEIQPWEYPVKVGETFAKQNLFRRWFQERDWGKAAASELGRLNPHLVIVANAPLEVVRVVQRWCQAHGKSFVFWMQDVHSFAITHALGGKLRLLNKPVSHHYRHLEAKLLEESDLVLLITEDHRSVLTELKVSHNRVRVFPNWSTVEDFPNDSCEQNVQPKELAWRATHGLTGKRLCLYSGTLGIKHDPEMLAELAAAVADDPTLAVVVISSGIGADRLKARASRLGLSNLYVIPFVEYSMLATTLEAAEVLLAILEPAAAQFSVPSKILTYACAGRPVVAAMSTANAASQLIRDLEFGIITPPGDAASFVDAVRGFLRDPDHAIACGRRGRSYAERNFPMQLVERRFLTALGGLV